MKIRIKDLFIKDEEIRVILDISLRQLINIVEGVGYSWGDFEQQFGGSVYKYLKELNVQCEIGVPSDSSDSDRDGE